VQKVHAQQEEFTMRETNGYSGLQIALHWAVAVGVVFNYIVSDGMEQAFDTMTEGGAATGLVSVLHVWVGVAVLAMVSLRILLRLTRGAPANPETGLMALAASLGHFTLYLLMFLVPLGGAITWFLQYDPTGELHQISANLLLIVAGLHALIALYHHYVKKDGLLMRMMRAG
jgi:cytochrome b561